MKKILILGGNYVQMTAIEAAKSQGYYVITVDYLPDNPGHKLADEYHNISTIDKDAILNLAKELNIDGIVSYASDISASTAAYVAEQLGLPTNPYESVNILTKKNLFRDFLKKNKYPMPKYRLFSNKEDALEYVLTYKGTCMLKPVDSSGSKGVTKLTNITQFSEAWDEAIKYSFSKKVIVEEFIQKKGYQIDGDIFVENGEIVFWGICDQHNDLECSPYVPVGLSFPSTQNIEIQNKAKQLVLKILKDLNMKMGAYNIEYIVGENEEIYILEIGPRNGGNLIPDTIYAASGFNMAVNTVRQAVGDLCIDLYQMPIKRCCSSYVIHSLKDGIFKDIEIDPIIRNKVIKQLLFVEPNSKIYKFSNGGYGIGAMVLSFENVDEMCSIIDSMNKYINVIVK